MPRFRPRAPRTKVRPGRGATPALTSGIAGASRGGRAGHDRRIAPDRACMTAAVGAHSDPAASVYRERTGCARSHGGDGERMGLHSMTGFARVDGSAAGQRWTWELRTVNGKGLDLRLRVPPGLDRLEIPARERFTKRLTRGSTQATLTVVREAGATLKVNEDVLQAVLGIMERIAGRVPTAPPSLDGILNIRGVLEQADAEESAESRKALDESVLAGLDQALVGLVDARAREGEAVARILLGHVAEIERLARLAEDCPARRPEAIRARLAEQVRELLDAVPALDPQRLHQEAVLIATRADIREELDRLYAHVAQARALVAEGGPVGRRLDFLAQEFNRETNTLCSKSNDRELTAIGLDLKAVVDQLREQIQNVE